MTYAVSVPKGNRPLLSATVSKSKVLSRFADAATARSLSEASDTARPREFIGRNFRSHRTGVCSSGGVPPSRGGLFTHWDSRSTALLARVPAGELDCSRQRPADRQGTGPAEMDETKRMSPGLRRPQTFRGAPPGSHRAGGSGRGRARSRVRSYRGSRRESPSGQRQRP